MQSAAGEAKSDALHQRICKLDRRLPFHSTHPAIALPDARLVGACCEHPARRACPFPSDHLATPHSTTLGSVSRSPVLDCQSGASGTLGLFGRFHPVVVANASPILAA